jgi:hypothetical protein
MLRTAAWCLVLVATWSVIGCDDSTSPARTTDAGSDATVAVPASTAAAHACETMSHCGFELLVSEKECTTQLADQFASMYSQRCFECMAEITCAGWDAVGRGEKKACEICGSVCNCAGDSGTHAGTGSGGSGMTAECTPSTRSVPNSPGDPCPQNDPKCPADRFDAVTTCDANGKWVRTDGMIMCACVPRNANSIMVGPTPTSVCGNGIVENPEQCDGTNLGATTCASVGLGTGPIRCDATCHLDISQCSGADDDAGT